MRASLLVCALACGAVSACSSVAAGSDEAVRQPTAILDAYAIAHGMAASYAQSANADPAVVRQLRRLDRRALAAVETLGPDISSQRASAAAVAALTDYAARQTATAQ